MLRAERARRRRRGGFAKAPGEEWLARARKARSAISNRRSLVVPRWRLGRLREALQRLVNLYTALDQPDKTAEWKQKLADFEKAQPKPKPKQP